MGPLAGVRVVELGGWGPGPFGAMLLADLGADVVRVHRSEVVDPMRPVGRGKRQIELDLKTDAGADAVRRLADLADVLVEPWRPGVAERLSLGPETLCARNPRLIYTRMTGWGQTGPLAGRAGHDIDYIALAGALDLIGRPGERPVPPPALLGDMAGGGLLMAMGVLAALYERERSGRGQVVDAAIVDGVSVLTTLFHGMAAAGSWSGGRGGNLIDGGSTYDTYETADGGYLAVGPLEPQFFAQLVELLELDGAGLPPYDDPRGWEPWKRLIAARLRERTRQEWTDLFEGTDACVTPVLSLGEVPEHPHNVARESFVEIDGARYPAPAPRFGRTPAGVPGPQRDLGNGVEQILAGWAVG